MTQIVDPAREHYEKIMEAHKRLVEEDPNRFAQRFTTNGKFDEDKFKKSFSNEDTRKAMYRFFDLVRAGFYGEKAAKNLTGIRLKPSRILDGADAAKYHREIQLRSLLKQ